MDDIKKQIEHLRRSTQNKRVLFAEDHETVHNSMVRMLQALFAKVDDAYNGEDAFAIYKDTLKKGASYDFVFSDIVMPRLNGVELAKKIKNLNPEQNIIIFSAYQDSAYLLDLINLGIRRFIQKPVSLEKLLSELQIICDDVAEQKLTTQNIHLASAVFYNKEQRTLYIEEKSITLTPYETLILELLLKHKNKTVSTEEIIEYLFIERYDVKADNIRKIIYKLRKKLPKGVIENVHSIGYILKISH